MKCLISILNLKYITELRTWWRNNERMFKECQDMLVSGMFHYMSSRGTADFGSTILHRLCNDMYKSDN